MSTVYLSAAHAADRRRGGIDRPGAAVPLCIAGLCVVALALTWVVAALVPATHVKDAVALHDFTLLGGPRLDDVANALLHLLDPLLYTIWGVLLIAVALVRRRPRVAFAVALVLSLAPLTAEILKPLLAHPHAWVGGSYVDAASWPSGHATAATALTLCAVLVTPARLRPIVAALGAMFAAGVGFSLLILAWHLPSDVLGGYLVGTLWVALAVAGLRAAEARSRSRRSRSRVRAVGAGVP
jgi:membrane-associated phospholipid phosphatase